MVHPSICRLGMSDSRWKERIYFETGADSWHFSAIRRPSVRPLIGIANEIRAESSGRRSHESFRPFNFDIGTVKFVC